MAVPNMPLIGHGLAAIAVVSLIAAAPVRGDSESAVQQAETAGSVVLRQPSTGAAAAVVQEGGGNVAVIVQGRSRPERTPARAEPRREVDRSRGCDPIPASPCPGSILEHHQPVVRAPGPSAGTAVQAVGRIGDIPPAPGAREALMRAPQSRTE